MTQIRMVYHGYWKFMSSIGCTLQKRSKSIKSEFLVFVSSSNRSLIVRENFETMSYHFVQTNHHIKFDI